ncbi:MAG: hypothetical protein HKN40_07860 [Winogradskyella sp.]|uniref:hypothetical protein n=1 Tax=Winogradskyella sp. TaxID=1883156 RepID=UPI001812C617|nr:hypothetical protein [Winogradskyella sp.]
MKNLIVLIALAFTFAINAQQDIHTENGCVLKIDKASLIAMNLDCDMLKGKTITSFKLKAPGHKTLVVKGYKMSNEAKLLVQQSKTGDKIVLFDIKLQESKEDAAPVSITLVEYH